VFQTLLTIHIDSTINKLCKTAQDKRTAYFKEVKSLIYALQHYREIVPTSVEISLNSEDRKCVLNDFAHKVNLLSADCDVINLQ